ncbi:hypothetical protein [Acinetobacter nectaris]|uniref:hypothetical protein n=1 Tax=Acinetobacter nectaris TaxID=1219382 RepID=UPI001F25DF6E|nr:hypothetical protein [Acinetobacter nectaris]MCF9034709.1 hypothetical protein [Acinetobacter nectaris]
MENRVSEKDQIIMAYSYHNIDHHLTGAFEYFWARGTGLASQSTDLQPPQFTAGYIPVFDETNQTWSLVEDHRYQVVYSTLNQQAAVIDYIGEIKEGFTTQKPSSSVETWTGKSWEDQRTDAEKRNDFLNTLSPLTQRQFKLVLLQNNLLKPIETAINNIADETKKSEIQIEYNYADSFERSSDSIAYMAKLLNLTDDQVDQIWQSAMKL